MATRYVGIALIPPILFGLLFLGRNRPVSRRIRDCLLSVLLACAPLGVWLTRNVATTSSFTDRHFAIHVVNLADAKELATTLLEFFMPGGVSYRIDLVLGLVTVLLLVGFFVGFAVFWRERYRRDEEDTIATVFSAIGLLYVVLFILFLFISKSFFDDETPFDFRILSPALTILLVAVTSVVWTMSQELGRPAVWRGFLAVLLISVGVNARQTITLATSIHRDGQGYERRRWQESACVAFAKTVSSDRKIYSNGPDILGFLTGKLVYWIPPKFDAANRRPSGNYIEEMQVMRADCDRNRAFVVYMNYSTRWYLPTKGELDSVWGLPRWRELTDGTVFGESCQQR
jgi:4-amino-4-deoxy-L-arabinose transferase-like glycosyltransferase